MKVIATIFIIMVAPFAIVSWAMLIESASWGLKRFLRKLREGGDHQ